MTASLDNSVQSDHICASAQVLQDLYLSLDLFLFDWFQRLHHALLVVTDVDRLEDLRILAAAELPHQLVIVLGRAVAARSPHHRTDYSTQSTNQEMTTRVGVYLNAGTQEGSREEGCRVGHASDSQIDITSADTHAHPRYYVGQVCRAGAGLRLVAPLHHVRLVVPVLARPVRVHVRVDPGSAGERHSGAAAVAGGPGRLQLRHGSETELVARSEQRKARIDTIAGYGGVWKSASVAGMITESALAAALHTLLLLPPSYFRLRSSVPTNIVAGKKTTGFGVCST